MALRRGGDYAKLTVINFSAGRILLDGRAERSILIDCSRSRWLLHIYLLINRLSVRRTSKNGPLNGRGGHYGKSVNITQPLSGGLHAPALRERKVRAQQVEGAFNLHVRCVRILNCKVLDLNLRAGFKCAC